MKIRFIKAFMGSPCPQYTRLYGEGQECAVPSPEMPDELAAVALSEGFAVVMTDEIAPEHTATVEPDEHKTRRRKK